MNDFSCTRGPRLSYPSCSIVMLLHTSFCFDHFFRPGYWPHREQPDFRTRLASLLCLASSGTGRLQPRSQLRTLGCHSFAYSCHYAVDVTDPCVEDGFVYQSCSLIFQSKGLINRSCTGTCFQAVARIPAIDIDANGQYCPV